MWNSLGKCPANRNVLRYLPILVGWVSGGGEGGRLVVGNKPIINLIQEECGELA